MAIVSLNVGDPISAVLGVFEKGLDLCIILAKDAPPDVRADIMVRYNEVMKGFIAVFNPELVARLQARAEKLGLDKPAKDDKEEGGS